MKQNCLDISTGHLTKKDAAILTQAAGGDSQASVFRVCSHEYGWIVFVMDETPEHQNEFSDEFLAIIKIAQSEKCILINFDRDAEIERSLPSFDWSPD
jgi:hypothetical protein